MKHKVASWFTIQRAANLTVIVLVIVVVLSQLHPLLLLQNTTATGGDTGSHLATAWYLRQHLGWSTLTGWYPGWYDGFPSYTYYFVLPDLLAALLSHVIGFNVAFKLVTILGSLLLPIAAYIMGRLFDAPDPVPAALAAATLPFLFDSTYTIDGGNLFSTLAGEYAFSLSLALALITIGLFARGIRTGRGRWLTAVMLSLTLSAHLLPWLWALVVAIVLVVIEFFAAGWPYSHSGGSLFTRHSRGAVWFVATTSALSAALSAWWLLPYITSQDYTSSMAYTNVPTSTFRDVFGVLGFFSGTDGVGGSGDRWVIVLACAAFLMAIFWRDRLGQTLTVSAILSVIVYISDPQGTLWNERFIPFWFISIYLSAGWLVGASLWHFIRWSTSRHRLTFENDEWATPAERDEHRGYVRGQRVVWATYIVALAMLIATVPGAVPQFASDLHFASNGNYVANWAQWNYSGYQSKPGWTEYHTLMTTMGSIGHRDGCGRAMWEYNKDENSFGTTEALMLLPYWTNNCIGSEEGLFFEDSATTPYHFLNQSELSAQPDYAMNNLSYNYTTFDVPLGVQHLQLLGVRYFMAYSPSIVAAANRDASLVQIAVTRRFHGSLDQWHIYLVKQSSVVQSLHYLPNVLPNVSGRVAWLDASEPWYLDPNRWSVPLAENGPSSWPRVASEKYFFKVPVAKTSVSDLRMGLQSLSFHVSRLNTPVLVKISYFPRWHVTGANGPYRVSPNLMVVIPTSHHVRLFYGSSPSVWWGNLLTDLAGVGLVIAIWRSRWWRRPRRSTSIALPTE